MIICIKSITEYGSGMTDVFVSYSRKNSNFAKRLVSALETEKKDVWVDWEDIPLSANWWGEICEGIESTDSFIFIMSPDSVSSPVCNFEIAHALHYNKRIIPIVREEVEEKEAFASLLKEELNQSSQEILGDRDLLSVARQSWGALARHNWIIFDDESQFDAQFKRLLENIHTDLEYVKVHTRYLQRAIEWESNERNVSFLLTGDEVKIAESWLSDSQGQQPQPTNLHYSFLAESRKFEDERIEQEQKRARRAKNIQRAFAASIILLVVVVGSLLINTVRIDDTELTATAFQQVIIQLSATPTPPIPPIPPTSRPAYMSSEQVGWQMFGINSPKAPVTVLPLEKYKSSEESFLIIEGENGDQLPLPPEFHGANVFLLPDSELEITNVNNALGEEHYELTLFAPTGEFFVNNHSFGRNGGMVLNLPQRDDISFQTEVYCAAAKYIPPAENPQTEEDTKERIAFTCFDFGDGDGKCTAHMPNEDIELTIGQRHLFNITDGKLISSTPVIYDEVGAYYNMVIYLTGIDEEASCLTYQLDADNDGFVYPDDLCESEPGPALGCPDADNDRVPDNLDACPDEFGLENFDDPSTNGCPP